MRLYIRQLYKKEAQQDDGDKGLVFTPRRVAAAMQGSQYTFLDSRLSDSSSESPSTTKVKVYEPSIRSAGSIDEMMTQRGERKFVGHRLIQLAGVGWDLKSGGVEAIVLSVMSHGSVDASEAAFPTRSLLPNRLPPGRYRRRSRTQRFQPPSFVVTVVSERMSMTLSRGIKRLSTLGSSQSHGAVLSAGTLSVIYPTTEDVVRGYNYRVGWLRRH